MREYAKVSAQYWINEQGRKIRQLGMEAQLISLYLVTNPHATMIGIYYLPITLIAHETGVSFDSALRGIQKLCEVDFCSYDHNSEYIWVRNMASEQVGTQLKQNDNRIKAINTALAALPKLPFIQSFYDKYAQEYFLENSQFLLGYSEVPLQPLPSQEQKQEKKQENKILMSSISSESHQRAPFISKQPTPLYLRTQALEVLQFLNEKTGRVYRPVDANLKLITARLKTGATVVDCRQVIAKKTREWKSDPKMVEYLRPATLFNATKFEQYMGELVMPNEELSHDNR